MLWSTTFSVVVYVVMALLVVGVVVRAWLRSRGRTGELDRELAHSTTEPE